MNAIFSLIQVATAPQPNAMPIVNVNHAVANQTTRKLAAAARNNLFSRHGRQSAVANVIFYQTSTQKNK